MQCKTLSTFALLTALSFAGACQPEKLGTSDSTGDTASESGSESDSESTAETITSGESMECTPGETKDIECGNVCECDGGTWACTDAACPTLEEGFAETLTSQGGCADLLMYALNSGATIAVELNGADLVTPAETSGEITKTEFALPSGDLQVIAKIGQNLHEELCTDFSEVAPTVDLTYLPVAGTLSITITPGVGDQSSQATADLKNVVWKLQGDDQAPTVNMPSLVIADVVVGWLPG